MHQRKERELCRLLERLWLVCLENGEYYTNFLDQLDEKKFERKGVVYKGKKFSFTRTKHLPMKENEQWEN